MRTLLGTRGDPDSGARSGSFRFPAGTLDDMATPKSGASADAAQRTDQTADVEREAPAPNPDNMTDDERRRNGFAMRGYDGPSAPGAPAGDARSRARRP